MSDIDTLRSCVRCGDKYSDDDSGAFSHKDFDWGQMAGVCHLCRRVYPASLMKAAVDEFYYVMKMQTGDIIYFSHCHLQGEWVHLIVAESWCDQKYQMPHPFERGLDVRLSDIVWCADAPEGS